MGDSLGRCSSRRQAREVCRRGRAALFSWFFAQCRSYWRRRRAILSSICTPTSARRRARISSNCARRNTTTSASFIMCSRARSCKRATRPARALAASPSTAGFTAIRRRTLTTRSTGGCGTQRRAASRWRRRGRMQTARSFLLRSPTSRRTSTTATRSLARSPRASRSRRRSRMRTPMAPAGRTRTSVYGTRLCSTIHLTIRLAWLSLTRRPSHRSSS